MGLFNITWRTQVTNLLPSFKRSVSLIDFITALLEGLSLKSTEWVSFDADMRKRAKFNGQILVLQSALNDIFGVSSAPFILIETIPATGNIGYVYNASEGVSTIYIYNTSELSEPPTYIYNTSEISGSEHFKVRIPSGIHTAELERRISSEVNTYKLAGKLFTVETY